MAASEPGPLTEVKVLKTRLKESYKTIVCSNCGTEVEWLPPDDVASVAYKLSCASCDQLFDPPKPKPATKARRIGTDERPIDLSYYEVLGISHDADLPAIKSAYRRLSLKFHPDKNPGDPKAEEKFKELALAYSTLSDPQARHRYNEFGPQSSQQDEAFIDPEAVFSTLFGGERFVDIIGVISLGQELKTAMQQSEEDPTSSNQEKKKKEISPEEKRVKEEKDRQQSEARSKARGERVKDLEAKLLRKLAVFTEQEEHPDLHFAVRAMWAIEADELKTEHFGVELLNTVGHVYLGKSRHYRASNSTPFGMGGWLHSAKSTAYVFGETVSTVRAALELNDIFKQLNAAEEKGISPERKKELEEKAAAKGLDALFKGAKLEVESVVREVCDRILNDSAASKVVLRRRAEALEILGTVYASVRKDSDTIDESEYVRIESKPKRSSAPPPPPPAREPPPPTYAPYQRKQP